MAQKKANKTPKRLSKKATRETSRLPDEKRAEHARVIEQVEEELGDRIEKATPARVALAKLKLARQREGLSLGDMAERTGISRARLWRLLNKVDNLGVKTLARLADGLGYDIVIDFRKRS